MIHSREFSCPCHKRKKKVLYEKRMIFFFVAQRYTVYEKTRVNIWELEVAVNIDFTVKNDWR